MGGTTRIVFVHPSDELYGADRILLDICDALTPSELAAAEFWLPTDVPHRSTPLCVALEARGASVRHHDLPVLRRAYRNPRAIVRLVARLVKVFRLFRAGRPPLVYLTTSAVYLCAPVARLAGVRRVVGHKQELWSSMDRRVLNLAARGCHRLIAISEPVRDDLSTSLRARSEVVLNATREPSKWTSLDGRQGPITYLVASRWNTWKGHRTLFAAWNAVDRPGRLIVLGGPPPAGEAIDVVGLVARVRNPEDIELVGEVSDVGPYIDMADVVIVPSDQPEPFGLLAIEAFARARPVIGSAAGGLDDIISDGYNGWKFPPQDAAALARLFAGLDRATVHAAGRHARATYEVRYQLRRFRENWRAAVGLEAGRPDRVAATGRP